MAIDRHSGTIEDLPKTCPVCGGQQFVIHAPFRICANGSCRNTVLFTKMKPAERRRPWHVVEKLVRARGWRDVLETGSQRGLIGYYLLEKIPDMRVTWCDDWPDFPKTREDLTNAAPRFSGRARVMSRRVDQVGVSSLDVVVLTPQRPVMREIAQWLPKLKETGVLIGTGGDRETLRAELAQRVPEPTYEEAGIWWLQKNQAFSR